VVLDSRDPFGGGALLPRGRLRDEPEALRRADWIVVTRCSQIDPALEQRIRQYTAAPIVAAELYVGSVEDIATKQAVNLCGKRVSIFCGIGSPKNFIHTIEEKGATIASSLVLGDHRPLSIEHLAAFAEQSAAQGAEMLVCTAKDRIKLPQHINSIKLRIACVEVELSFGKEGAQWNDWVNSCF
jgi:tetraacyldisaccharide 4'-kinase